MQNHVNRIVSWGSNLANEPYNSLQSLHTFPFVLSGVSIQQQTRWLKYRKSNIKNTWIERQAMHLHGIYCSQNGNTWFTVRTLVRNGCVRLCAWRISDRREWALCKRSICWIITSGPAWDDIENDSPVRVHVCVCASHRNCIYEWPMERRCNTSQGNGTSGNNRTPSSSTQYR